MKKIAISSVLVFISLIACAQTEKGRFMIGGSIGFTSMRDRVKSSSVTTRGDKYTNINVNPTLGYFLVNRIVAGIGLNIFSLNDKNAAGTSSSTNSGLTFTPFTRYYHESGFFGHLNIEVGSSKFKFKSRGATNESKDRVFGWKFGGGYVLFLNNNIAIEPMITYGSTAFKSKDSATDFARTSSGLMINIGFNIFIDDLNF